MGEPIAILAVYAGVGLLVLVALSLVRARRSMALRPASAAA